MLTQQFRRVFDGRHCDDLLSLQAMSLVLASCILLYNEGGMISTLKELAENGSKRLARQLNLEDGLIVQCCHKQLLL